MFPIGLLKAMASTVRDHEPVVGVRRRLYDRRFARSSGWHNLARGLYGSFAEARADAPATMPVGYVLDDDAYERHATVEAHDYPALFWLRAALEGGCTLLDFGGHVGLQYYLYRDYVALAPATRWIVAEQPAVVTRGRALARRRDAPHLAFVEDPAAAGRVDVVMTAGCIQSVEEPFAHLLGRLPALPRAVLINKLPLYDQPTRVTLQNTGCSFTPCTLFNADAFVGSLTALGYRLRDRWQCLDRSIDIPFYPAYRVPTYSGLYFEPA